MQNSSLLLCPTADSSRFQFPVYEIILSKSFRIEHLLFTVQHTFQLSYSVIKADITYMDEHNFGSLFLVLKADEERILEITDYLNLNKITFYYRGLSE